TGQLLIGPDNSAAITTSLTINRPGAFLLAITTNGSSRVLKIDGNSQAIVKGLTITGGNGGGPGEYDGYGGGVIVRGGYLGENVDNLTLIDSIISDNRTVTANGSGGGMFLAGSALIKNS